MIDSAKSKLQREAAEVRQRWGNTEAYRESEHRTADYSQKDRDELAAEIDRIMEGFALLKASGVYPDDSEARLQVEKLQSYITEKMYTCTDEILAGLGEMYVADERFRNNIDRHGEGTARYVSECIRQYKK